MEVGEFWSARGTLHRGATLARDVDEEMPEEARVNQAGGHAAAPQAEPKALSDVELTVPSTWNSHQVAEYIIEQARATETSDAAGSPPQNQAPAPDTRLHSEFERFEEARSPADNAKKATPPASKLEAVKSYLSGLTAGDTSKFGRAFLQIAQNINDARTIKPQELPAFGRGFLYGFFIDGAWGNVSGLWQLAKTAVSLAWLYETQYRPDVLIGRAIGGDDFSTEREYAEKVQEFATLAYQVTQAVTQEIGTELGEQAFAHYHALTEGTPEELRALGDVHQQLAAAMLGVGVEVSQVVKDISPEVKGEILGAISWEVAQTAVETLLTAGASKAVTGSARFAAIADKLADFGKISKYADKFGDVARDICKLFGEGTAFRRLCAKLDVVLDGARFVANFLCFTRDTLVATANGPKPIGQIQPGDRVQSFDFATGEWSLGEVVKRHDNVYAGRIVTVEIGRTRIEATAGHPFCVLAGEDLSARGIPRELDEYEDEGKALPGRWVSAPDLRAGDVLIGLDGDHRRIDAVDIREEAEIPVSNLTVRGCHTYAVGPLAILVHNGDAFCDVYRVALNRVGQAAKMVASPALLAASKAQGVAIHAHHIVLKTISWTDRWLGRAPYIKRAQKVLEDVGIPLLDEIADFTTKVKNAGDLANMTWALNRDHSKAYVRSVAEAIEDAFKKGGNTKAGQRTEVLRALQKIAEELSQGHKYRFP